MFVTKQDLRGERDELAARSAAAPVEYIPAHKVPIVSAIHGHRLL